MLIGSNQIIMIFIVFFLIFSFAIGQVVWIYLDSKKREDKWGILWSILAITPIFLPILLPLPLIVYLLSLIHISEPTRLGMISYAVFCLKKKKHPYILD